MILVTGGTGFVGRHVVAELCKRGHDVRVLARKPAKAKPLQELTGCEIAYGDVLKPETLPAACQNVTAIIHLVGIIFEIGDATYERIHVEGTRNMVQAAEAAGIKRFLQMSAIGTRPLAPSRYHQTKWLAEDFVRESDLDWTVLRPSVIYGRQDQFVRAFSMLMDFPFSLASFGALPLPYKGKSLMQPVTVTAVAEAFVNALTRQSAVSKTYELCGPQISMADMLAAIAEAKGLKPVQLDVNLPAVPFFLPYYFLKRQQPVLFQVPGEIMRIAAWMVEHFSPVAVMNTDQMLMLQEDQNGDPTPAAEDLGINVPDFRNGIEFLQS
ncbi:MAG: complex I NDUFA9 subunit family protein [Verrucomicrobiota bacterium]